MSPKFFRRQALAAAVLLGGQFAALDTAGAAARLSISQALTEVEGWTVGKNESAGGCLAAATYQDGTTIWVGFDEQGAGVIGFTNPKWRSIEAGQRYAIQMKARGGRNWRGTFVGTERKDEKGIVADDAKIDFLADFARAGGMGVFIDGKTVAKLSLSGSRAALDAVAACRGTDGPAPGRPSAGQARPSPESHGSSSGTGFFVSQKGHILTNNHVVKGCKTFRVSVPGALKHEASVVASDETNDLALLVSDIKPPSVPGFNRRPQTGESIFVYGFPLTGVLASTGNFTAGNVTATAGLNDDTSLLQISAPVQPGNSGGPLIDKDGNILGVIVSKLNALRVAKVTDDIPQNVNFAIKSTIAMNFLESNNITPNVATAGRSLEATAVAELSKMFTVRVMCEK